MTTPSAATQAVLAADHAGGAAEVQEWDTRAARLGSSENVSDWNYSDDDIAQAIVILNLPDVLA